MIFFKVTAEMLNASNWMMVVATSNGALCVMMGAFGAHALKQRLSADMLAVYDTAVQYHMWHTMALLTLAVFCTTVEINRFAYSAAILFAIGMLLFSGSLYLLAITGLKYLGIITPFGGVALIIAWLCFMCFVVSH